MDLNASLASISKSHAAVRKLAETGPIYRTTFQGIAIDIEKRPGFVQSGISPEGKPWTRVYGYRPDGTKVDGLVGYGYIPGTAAEDGEDVDVYLGNVTDAPMAYVIEQGLPDPECKICIGWASQRDAIDVYLAHTPIRMLQGVWCVPMAIVRSLLCAFDEIAKSYQCVSFAVQIMKAARDLVEAHEPISPVDLAKSALPIPRSTASLLIEAGPPDGWSGTIAAMIGDRKDGVIALWNALSEKEQISVRVAFGSLMCVDTIERSLKIEHADLAKSDDAAPAFKVEAQFITKSIDEELRYVLGYVLEPLDGRAGEADTQGDFYTADTIREAMWGYMKFFRNVSLNHKAYLNGRVFVVECWQTKNDEVIDGSQVRAGTWMLGIHIPDDDIWGMVKRGELRALSIGGTAEKVPFA